MTTCRGVLDALSDYLEGDAGKAVCKEIERHLEGCERCRMHVDAMKLMITLYKKWRDEPIPEDVSVRLRGIIAREAKKEGVGRRGGKSPGGSCAMPAPGARPKQPVKVPSKQDTKSRKRMIPRKKVKKAAKKATGAKAAGKGRARKSPRADTTRKTGKTRRK
jgi:hypothetical protein